MARVLPFVVSLLLLFVAESVAAASLDERANAAFAHVQLRPDQQAPYEALVRDYYKNMNEMLKRASWQNSGELLQKIVRNRGEKISDQTMEKAGKVLDDKQLEDFRYALDLANRSFVESIEKE
jgi:hypothetical protein